MPKQPKDHVKKHLDKRGINHVTLSDGVIDALNAFTPDELKKVDDLGTALTSDPIQPPLKVSAVH